MSQTTKDYPGINTCHRVCSSRFDWQADIKRLPMKPKKPEGQYTCESKLKPLQSTWGEGQSNNSHFKYKYNVLAKLISWHLDGFGLQRESSQEVACSLADCTDNSQPDLFLVTPYINLPLELTLFLFLKDTHTRWFCRLQISHQIVLTDCGKEMSGLISESLLQPF